MGSRAIRRKKAARVAKKRQAALRNNSTQDLPSDDESSTIIATPTTSESAEQEEATGSPSNPASENRAEDTRYHFVNQRYQREDIHPDPVITVTTTHTITTTTRNMPANPTRGLKVMISGPDGSDMDLANNQPDLKSRMDENTYHIVEEIAAKADQLAILQQCAKVTPRDTDKEKLTILLRPVAVLKAASARFVPQWDDELLGDNAPDDVDKSKPPEELDFSLMNVENCRQGEPCGGLTWLYNKDMPHMVEAHPQHASFVKMHFNARSTMLVKIAGHYMPEVEWRIEQTGIAFQFARHSDFNVTNSIDLNEIFYPLVNGKKAATAPPPGREPHGLKQDQEMADLCAAICALRVVDQRIVPFRLKMLMEQFRGDRTQPDTPAGVKESAQFRVVLVTDSKYLVRTMCDTVAKHERRFLAADKRALDWLGPREGEMSKSDENAEMEAKLAVSFGEALDGDDSVYVRKDGRPIHNSLAITTLEAVVATLALKGVQVKYLLAPKEVLAIARKTAEHVVTAKPETEARLKKLVADRKAGIQPAVVDEDEDSDSEEEDYIEVIEFPELKKQPAETMSEADAAPEASAK